ncbi:MAG: protein-L-isoaspartate(D-aspartate) O-methyltransferase [Halofilum sp. (in: g-proteobacteria)]|nr:protein-L-isoaspartate(D-aspartate) O-methyltransferase [Halofilum sp. (in: g-proteobacteria)]
MLRYLTEKDISGVGMTSQRTRDRLIERLRDKGIDDERVLQQMRRTPRHLFMDEAMASRAYEDTALPIGHGQTISQPFVVARMTAALLEGMPTEPPLRVLEIGTGSGYQAAVLAGLVDEVYTIERIGPLLTRARERFRQLRLRNVHCRHDDGTAGWPAHAPYQGILVTAAPERVPQALFEQLDPAGCLVVPVGGAGGQELVRYRYDGDGRLQRQFLDLVSFVPFVGGRD